jgi:hypothetical protein
MATITNHHGLYTAIGPAMINDENTGIQSQPGGVN